MDCKASFEATFALRPWCADTAKRTALKSFIVTSLDGQSAEVMARGATSHGEIGIPIPEPMVHVWHEDFSHEHAEDGVSDRRHNTPFESTLELFP